MEIFDWMKNQFQLCEILVFGKLIIFHYFAEDLLCCQQQEQAEGR
jgi:hypothetical protein